MEEIQEVRYEIKRSQRARHYSMSIKTDGRIVLTAPMRASAASIESFAQRSAPWIAKHLRKLKEYKSFPEGTGTKKHYDAHKEAAREVITERVRHFNHFYNFPIEGISIRNQAGRWGSCSKDKNLSFNYRLYFLPQELMDYVVAHEICHIKEMNHKKVFWDLVAQAIPDYKTRRKELRRYRLL